MNVPQFKRWLEQNIEYVQAFPDEARNPDDRIQIKGFINEAYEHAVALRLPEAAAACRRGPATIRLIECLNAIPDTRAVLTPPEIAEQLGAAPETVTGWIKSGQLKGANLATDRRPRYVVEPDDLATFLKSRQPQPPVKRQPKAKPAYKRFSE